MYAFDKLAISTILNSYFIFKICIFDLNLFSFWIFPHCTLLIIANLSYDAKDSFSLFDWYCISFFWNISFWNLNSLDILHFCLFPNSFHSVFLYFATKSIELVAPYSYNINSCSSLIIAHSALNSGIVASTSFNLFSY